ncbi:phoH-like protein, partial [Vibrio parahaemolyticus AQ3810]
TPTRSGKRKIKKNVKSSRNVAVKSVMLNC